MTPSPKPPSRSTSRDLERYAALFASRTRGMTSSAMRDMMAITARPEVISLASGLADTSTFPPALLEEITDAIARQSSAKALQYGPTDGGEGTRRAAAALMAAEGMRVDTDDIVITTGGQQVIDLVVKTLIDPGDVVLAEGPTYPGAVPVFNAYQADVEQIPMDEHGMRVDLLEEAMDRLEAEGRRLKFIYTVPTFQNPGGATMSLERRRRLVEIANEREVLVLEDNPYGLLRYEGDPLPPLHKLDGGVFVMYLGTFSKIFSPGLRVGWVAAPPPVLDKINLGKQEADLCTSTLAQMVVERFFADHDWRAYVASLCDHYRPRRDAMLAALEQHFPAQATWTKPQGGMFLWVTLPDYIDTTDLLARALRDNVAFVPGEGSFLDGRGRNSMRLNFSVSTEEEIHEGIRRIGRVIEEQVGLYGTLTGEMQAISTEELRVAEAAGDAEEGARVVEMRRKRAAGS